jgi:hypothetical protein
MDTKEIKILLEKYFDGQSTLREEQELSDYFKEEEIPSPMKQQFMLFRTWKEEVPAGMEGFESRLAGFIDAQQEAPIRKIRSGFYQRLAVAATVAVLIGISALMIIQNNWRHNRDTYEDPQQAYAEAQKTLLYVAEKMNRGIEPLSAVSKINAGNEHLKSLKKLNSSMDMLNMVSFINNSSNLKK